MTKVYEAIAAITGELSQIGISKSSKNQQQGFMYRGIDAVYNTLAPLLSKHKLNILPRCLTRESTERQTAKGGLLMYVVVHAEFDFVSAEDGSRHTVAMFGEAMDSGDKATNKAMSIAFKYAAFQAFCIPTEETAQDPDAEVHQPQPRQPKQSKPAPEPESDATVLATMTAAMESCTTLEALQSTFASNWKNSRHAPEIKQSYDSLKAKFTSMGEQA